MNASELSARLKEPDAEGGEDAPPRPWFEELTDACRTSIYDRILDVVHPDKRNPPWRWKEIRELDCKPTTLKEVIDNVAAFDDEEVKAVPISFIFPDMVPFARRALPPRLDIDYREHAKMTVSVWCALDYLFDSFAEGGNFIDVLEAERVCWYRWLIMTGALKFDEYTFVDVEPELAELLCKSIKLGYWEEWYEIRVILERVLKL